jgi:hypothetical protein
VNLNILKEMVTSIYTADVKLNKTDKDYTKHILIKNDEGILLINKGLCSISFWNEADLEKNSVDIKDKRHIGDITL